MNDDQANELLSRVEELERRLDEERARSEAQARQINDLMAILPSINHPLARVFLARKDGTNFQEQRPTTGTGAPTDWTEARNGEITDRGTAIMMLEIPEGATFRYMEIGSSETCNEDDPVVLGSATEQTEAAATDEWIYDPEAPQAFDFWVVTNVGYFEAGDETLYAYKRKMRVNSCGKIYAASAETRVSVEVPELCNPA